GRSAPTTGPTTGVEGCLYPTRTSRCSAGVHTSGIGAKAANGLQIRTQGAHRACGAHRLSCWPPLQRDRAKNGRAKNRATRAFGSPGPALNFGPTPPGSGLVGAGAVGRLARRAAVRHAQRCPEPAWFGASSWVERAAREVDTTRCLREPVYLRLRLAAAVAGASGRRC